MGRAETPRAERAGAFRAVPANPGLCCPSAGKPVFRSRPVAPVAFSGGRGRSLRDLATSRASPSRAGGSATRHPLWHARLQPLKPPENPCGAAPSAQ